jgi:uncharacterized protein GlcG (DUF336 family)
MITKKTLSLDEAMKVVNAAVDYAKAKNHVGIAVVVMDKNAEIIAAAKMDNRSSRYFKAALRKAYSAAVFERDTSKIVEFHRDMEAKGHRGPSDWNDSMLTTLPGGYVVVDSDDQVLGAIAVAGGGGSPETTDWAIADVAFSALGEAYHHRPGHHE